MTKKKAKLTAEEVEHVAELAKLELTPSELKKFQSQLSKVLDYVSQLSKVKTDVVEPTSQITDLENVFRDDQSSISLPQKDVLSGTKQARNGFFQTKAIFE